MQGKRKEQFDSRFPTFGSFQKGIRGDLKSVRQTTIILHVLGMTNSVKVVIFSHFLYFQVDKLKETPPPPFFLLFPTLVLSFPSSSLQLDTGKVD